MSAYRKKQMHCPASIFNDVIGPVMRGPSSSHVAGAARIGLLVRQSLNNKVRKVTVDFDINGSLAESYHGHGSDTGFASGILGMELTNESVPQACEIAAEEGIDIQFNVLDYGAVHPGNYRIKACSEDGRWIAWEAVSVGGGMVEMQKYNGFDVSIAGDCYELLVTLDTPGSPPASTMEAIKEIIPDYEDITVSESTEQSLVTVKRCSGTDEAILLLLAALPAVQDVVSLKPILPTQSTAACEVPFTTAGQLSEWLSKNGRKEFWELAAMYEAKRGNTDTDDVLKKMSHLVDIMTSCIEQGLSGTEYEDRILGPQAYKIDEGLKNGRLIPGDILNRVIKYITAIMEVKSSMGIIIAAPTAGSCGCLPGTIIGAGSAMGFEHDETTKAILAAGLIGAFIAEGATFSAEVAGCQVECGAGSAMAAAGLVQLFHGTAEQCIDAASMALQNITGLACDPVANRVEVPCLGKNIMGGVNAIACANMALAGYDKVIPLDETIAAVYDIGTKLPLELRCTFGGLGKTRTSVDIQKKLK
jgi:L-serine dehydratase